MPRSPSSLQPSKQPDARSQIRKALEPNVSNLIQAANDLLDEAVTRLKAKGYNDLVLIVDNLDRIVLRSIPDSQFQHTRTTIHQSRDPVE
jgi:hypothetical protein